jgi:ribosomal protein L11 methyltransferase
VAAGRAPGGWWELTVPAATETSEALTNFLWELGALGVVEEEAPGAPACLRAFFADRIPAADLATRVSDYVADLVALGLPSGGAPTVAAVVDPGWAEAWREHFRPVPVGRRLEIIPPWHAARGEARLAIVIEPGRAFGTGHHGSTAGCLVAIEAAVERYAPPRAIDVGTGSGILAIAAARLGVEHVLAIDDDPDAIAAAVANTARNGVCDRVRCVIGDAGALRADAAPLLVANLLSAAHHRLGTRYATLVTAGGVLILGGILDAEADGVRAVVASAGFTPEHTLSLEGWTTVVMRRVGADATVHVRA